VKRTITAHTHTFIPPRGNILRKKPRPWY